MKNFILKLGLNKTLLYLSLTYLLIIFSSYLVFVYYLNQFVENITLNTPTAVKNNLYLVAGISLALLLVLFTAFVFLLYKMLVKPVVKTHAALQDINDENQVALPDTFMEITDIINNVNYFKRNLLSSSQFVKEIGNGNLQADFTGLHDEEKSKNLPAALLEMREKLIQVEQDEAQRIWTSDGIAKFMEILRTNNDDVKELSNKIISNLVIYVGANQGGLFIMEGDINAKDSYLDLIAAYAFEKRKYMQKHVEIGEGLLGQCVLEADTIYITEIPHDYIQITSGLGGTNPSGILIVPLKSNDVVLGALELASFNKFESFQIKFIEKLAENIASSISAVKVNERTKRLLNESQQMTEELRAQEEEVRQNMEELQATQEEMNRITSEMKAQNDIINSIAIVSKTDRRGNITYVNEEFLKWSKYTRDEVIGKNHRMLKSGDQPDEIFTELWKTISSGRIFRGEIKNKAKDGSIYWVDAIIAPILDENGKPKEYIAQRFVINDAKEKEAKLQEAFQILERNEKVNKMEYSNIFKA